MPVGVVHVRHVRVAMAQALVAMQMRVRLARRIVGTVSMLVVLIVSMPVGVLHRLMHMLVLMILCEV